jgi:hypothetical protein
MMNFLSRRFVKKGEGDVPHVTKFLSDFFLGWGEPKGFCGGELDGFIKRKVDRIFFVEVSSQYGRGLRGFSGVKKFMRCKVHVHWQCVHR